MTWRVAFRLGTVFEPKIRRRRALSDSPGHVRDMGTRRRCCDLSLFQRRHAGNSSSGQNLVSLYRSDRGERHRRLGPDRMVENAGLIAVFPTFPAKEQCKHNESHGYQSSDRNTSNHSAIENGSARCARRRLRRTS